MDILSIAVGAAGVGLAYFVYLAATKGLPAAVAWVRARWTAGRAELANLGADVDQAHVKIDAALAKLNVLQDAVATVQADVVALKAAAPAVLPFVAAVAPPTPVAAAPIPAGSAAGAV
jgi:hypothetical protein